MKTILIISCFLLFACKPQEKTPTTSPPLVTTNNMNPAIDTGFPKFSNRFLSLAASKGYSLTMSNLTIQYDASLSGSNILGSCAIYSTPTRKVISINQTYWEQWANQGRSSEMEQLMFHELSHCLLNRTHKDTTMTSSDNSTSVPTSIMNSYHISRTLYEGNYTYYINELFNINYVGNVYANNSSSFPTGVYASKMEVAQYYSVKLKDQENYVQDQSDLGIESFECDQSNI